jgi:hypothetical protein
MTHNIIKKENYLLIVDDSKIELGSWHTCIYPEYPLEARFTDESTKYDICKGCKNIIAHLPLNNAPALEGVDLLPPLENDVKELAKKFTNHLTFPEERIDGFIQGYNKAKEKYKYTEEDLRKAIDMADKHFIDFTNDIIQSLQQPKIPIRFNLEAKDTHIQNGVLVKSQWVGEYIY